MSSTATVVVGILPIALSSSLNSNATVSVIGGRLCVCPPWQNLYSWSCGWIKDQQSCVTVQSLPFPFTIPVFRFYDLALAISSSGTLWTYNTTLMHMHKFHAAHTQYYSFPEGCTLQCICFDGNLRQMP
jgi:hypothetical protein